MWLKHLRIVVFLFTCHNLTGQNSISGLEEELSKYKDDDLEYVATLSELAKNYAETHPDTALLLAEQTRELAIRHGNDSILGQIHVAYSTCFSFLAQYDSSMRHAFEALKVAENYSDTITQIDAYNNLGIDFMMQENDEKAIAYFRSVESLSRVFGDSLRWGHALNNIGMMLGYADQFEAELDYYQQAAELFKSIGELEGLANTFLNTGTVHTALENYDKADEAYQKALEIFTELDMSSGIQNTLLSMAENLMEKGDVTNAKETALNALQLAKKYKYGQDEIYTYELLGQIALKAANFQEAYHFQATKNDIKDQVFTAQKARQIAEIEAKYRTEKKEQELAIASLRLKQERTKKYIWMALLILIVILGVPIAYIIRQKSRLQQKLLSEEVENLRLKISSMLGDSHAIKLSLDELNQKLHQPLTDREFEVLNLTISDKTNQQIAEEVFISVNTVKYHLKNVYQKLGVKNRKEALNLMVNQS